MFLISSLPLFSCPKETVEKSHAANDRNAAPRLVISTAAGQPPIGKPLIVQAREALINS